MVVGRLRSYWEGNFSGAMLNFGGVVHQNLYLDEFKTLIENSTPSCETWNKENPMIWDVYTPPKLTVRPWK